MAAPFRPGDPARHVLRGPRRRGRPAEGAVAAIGEAIAAAGRLLQHRRQRGQFADQHRDVAAFFVGGGDHLVGAAVGQGARGAAAVGVVGAGRGLWGAVGGEGAFQAGFGGGFFGPFGAVGVDAVDRPAAAAFGDEAVVVGGPGGEAFEEEGFAGEGAGGGPRGQRALAGARGAAALPAGGGAVFDAVGRVGPKARVDLGQHLGAGGFDRARVLGGDLRRRFGLRAEVGVGGGAEGADEGEPWFGGRGEVARVEELGAAGAARGEGTDVRAPAEVGFEAIEAPEPRFAVFAAGQAVGFGVVFLHPDQIVRGARRGRERDVDAAGAVDRDRRGAVFAAFGGEARSEEFPARTARLQFAGFRFGFEGAVQIEGRVEVAARAGGQRADVAARQVAAFDRFDEGAALVEDLDRFAFADEDVAAGGRAGGELAPVRARFELPRSRFAEAGEEFDFFFARARGGVEHLHAVVAGFDHVDVACGVDRDRFGGFELSLAASFAAFLAAARLGAALQFGLGVCRVNFPAPGLDELPPGGELVDAGVCGVGDVDVAGEVRIGAEADDAVAHPPRALPRQFVFGALEEGRRGGCGGGGRGGHPHRHSHHRRGEEDRCPTRAGEGWDRQSHRRALRIRARQRLAWPDCLRAALA